MTFTETALQGAWVIDIDRIEDERGFFACLWTPDDFTSRGLDPTLAQCNMSWNHRRGTIRGLHFQRRPMQETKVVRCTRGAMLDIIVDIRPDSPSFCQWTSVELTDENRRMLYIPVGFAHGYQTLVDGVEVHYHVSAPYSSAHVSGLRWNDSRFGIQWPLEPTVISERDTAWPDFSA